MSTRLTHRHGMFIHEHSHDRPHRHARLPFRSIELADDHDHLHHHGDDHHREHVHAHEHGHSHGLVDRNIVRSRAGVQAVARSLAILAATAALQALVFVTTHSVALLADLIHNGGDALTAIPLGIAFILVSARGERIAGYVVVATIFASACFAATEAVQRLIHPQHLHHLPVLALAGIIGFAGNELAARVRLRAGRRLDSPALVADGHHARVDGFVSLGVVVSAFLAAVDVTVADPLIGLAITGLILRITWQAWGTIRSSAAQDDA
jgi:cation diffusion facilitator family transporter